MTTRDEPQTPDAEIVDAVLRMLEADGEVHRGQLLHRFPAREGDVDHAIAAVERYRRLERAARAQRAVGAGDDVLPPGTSLGEYTITGPLGRGNMGVVYRARQRSLGDREVALKVLPTALVARDPSAFERFRREAESASGVDHPNLASVYGYGTEQGLSYFAMQLIEGRTLADVLSGLVLRQRLGATRHMQSDFVRQSARMVAGVADALSAIHEKGLIHRDVKPSNVILQGASDDDFDALQSRPVLVDFGLVRPLDGSDLTGSQTLLGTPAYAAPEAQLHKPLSASTDTFALGAVLHDLLSLTRADARSPASAGMREVRALNLAVDERLAAIVEMALQEEPHLRYQDGATLREELSRYLHNKPIHAKPDSTLGRLRLWARREPARALRVGALTGVLALIVSVPTSYVAYQVSGTYATASTLRRQEQSGDLVGAQESALNLLRRGSLARLLPGLADNIKKAEGYRGSIGDIIGQFRDEGDSWDESRLREAHARAQTAVLTPGQDDWDARFLAFFCRQIEHAEPHLGVRRLLAAESVSAYLVVHPLPSGWSTSGEATIAGHGAAVRVPRETWQRLRAALLQAAGPGGPPALRRHAVAALSGVTDVDVFLTLVGLIEDPDVEVARLAAESTYRQWWQMRVDGFLDHLANHILRLWGEALYRRARAGRMGENELIAPAYLVAWTSLLRGLDPGMPLWDALTDRERLHMRTVQSVFAAYEESAKEAISLPSYEWTVFDYERFDSPEYRAGGIPMVEMKRWYSHTQNPYTYINIWRGEMDLVQGTRCALDTAPTPESPDLAQFRSMDGGKPVLSGSALEVSWEGVTPVTDDEGPEKFLLFDALGAPGLRFRFALPDLEHDGLFIGVSHRKAARFFFPDKGRAWVRISLGTGEIIAECSAPENVSGLGIHVDGRFFAGRDEAELVIQLVAGTTTYRLYAVTVRREKGWSWDVPWGR